jgi:hypothetical protein
VIFNCKQVFPAKFHLLKPLLCAATFCTACFAMALKKNSHERLHCVTLLPVPQIIMQQVARSNAQSRTGFYIWQRLQQLFSALQAHCSM